MKWKYSENVELVLSALHEQERGTQFGYEGRMWASVGSDNGIVDTAAQVQKIHRNTPKSYQLNLAFFVAGCCC
jgi:hypothetical protein